ncbi:MAG: hypothetical protein ACRD4X_17130 [Candidatus Acidiferrales bacterium]
MNRIHTAIVILLLSSAPLVASRASAAEAAKKLPAHCDRACLTGAMNNYLAALVAHDPSRVPLAPNVEFVDNTKVLHPGEGLWKTADALPTTFKIYVPDPVSEEIGFMGEMRVDDQPTQVAVRLKIRHGEIVAAEHLYATSTPSQMKNLQTPRPAFLEKVPPSERNTRAEMLKIAPMYYTAVTSADSNNAPFADDCVRRENGMQTTGNPLPASHTPRQVLGSLGCGAQLKTHVMDYIKRIEPRRVMIADPETGLVMGFSQFRHPMDQKTEKIVGVPGVTSQNMNFKPFDNVAVHIFKVYDGKIHEIEALGHSQMPYDCPTGWENFPDHGR